MELETITSRENPLLMRTEIHYRIYHPNETTPKREMVREELARKMNITKDRVIVDHLKSEFGKSETLGYAKIYKNREEAQKIEREHILKRNFLEKIGKPAKKKKKKSKK